MKILLLATTASFAFAGTVLAGNPAPISPAAAVIVPPVANTGADWGGFYLGATYGMGLGGDMEYVTGGAVQGTFDDLESGSNYGAFAGYNIQRNNLVFGGEIAYSQVDTPGYGPIGFPAETFNYFVDGKARVGYAMNKVLVYGFAGYTVSQFELGANTWATNGFNYGAGVDIMLGEHMFMGAEYIGRNLSGETSNAGQIQTTNIQAVQLRAGWKF